MSKQPPAYVRSFGEGIDDPAIVGGKGASLVRLAGAGLPVPAGFVVTTEAYREFVVGDLDDQIQAASALPPARASAEISAAFARHDLPEAVEAAVREALPPVGVAVRSSASEEDSRTASFAGQHDSFMNVHGADAVLDAIRDCWASLWTDRAIAYREQHGITHRSASIAVVVQEFVAAEVAGVMFTADPVTGVHTEVVINAAWGLGEALVGGMVTPDVYVVERGGAEKSRQVSDKAVRSVAAAGGGVHEAPVPDSERGRPALDQTQSAALARLGERIEALHGTPVDVEWTLRDGRFAIVQSRPISTLEIWNSTLQGDYLWTCVNVGEAVPNVMTPATWSLISALAAPPIGPHAVAGNIAGRFYLNMSATMSLADALGMGRVTRLSNELTFGRLPEGMQIPPLPLSRGRLLRAGIRMALPLARDTLAMSRKLPELAARNRAKCRDLRNRIAQTSTSAQLHALWLTEVRPLLHEVSPVFDAAARTQRGRRLQDALRELVGEEDARTLLSGLHGPENPLASLGPVLGLAQVRAGTLDRDDYIDEWGHRGPDEFEVSAPRPAEDPAWLDRQLAQFADPAPLLAQQAASREDAWQRLVAASPPAAGRWRPRLAKAAEQGRAREAARSEFVRTFWVFRAFIQRAGELTACGDDLFFLTVEDVATALTGVTTPLASVPARRAAYERYRALPAPPTFIRGYYDTERGNPDAHHAGTRAAPHPGRAVLAGFPCTAGVVEGAARVVATIADGESLQAGEILVTRVTNVGWTPLFLRAAAVVTDVGAPLSHAAIVARELGIPAVVGCMDATHRIASGDRLRVDGAAGTVTVLVSGAASGG